MTEIAICSAAPAIGLANLLGLPVDCMTAGAPLPPGFHILYFNLFGPLDDVGGDGHDKRHGPQAPEDLPRRMYAGARTRFERPLLISDAISRTERVLSTERKEGRSGALLFARHSLTISGPAGPCVIEDRTIVYRATGPAASGTPPRADRTAEHTLEFHPDEVALFRFSALSGNSHRIHYDQPYATIVEGYPALVVHGPLIALRLLTFAAALGGSDAIETFEFRAVSPVFLGDDARLCATVEPGLIRLWAEKDSGALCMTAEARLR